MPILPGSGGRGTGFDRLERRVARPDGEMPMLGAVRFLSLFCTTIAFALTLCHVLELPGKLALSGDVWLTVQHRLYGAFAWAGAIGEIGAVIFSAWLFVLLRRRRPSGPLALLAALCSIAGLGSWLVLIAPLNEIIAAATPASLPAGWETIRCQWEWGHAFAAGLFTVAWMALVLGLLADSAGAASLPARGRGRARLRGGAGRRRATGDGPRP
jgi:hypothetical protein